MTAAPSILWLTADCAPHHWSGIGVAVARQHRALREAGVDVRLLVARPDASRVCVSDSHDHITWLERGAPFPLAPERFEWLHLHSLGLGALALELQRRFGLRLACTVHGIVACEPLDGVTPHERRAWSELQLQLWRVAERVVFLSLAEARIGCSLCPDVADKAVVIPHGLPARELARRSRPDAAMVFVGRYARSKGLELLEQIVPELLAHHRGGFDFIGGHGDAHGHAIVERLTERFPGRCHNLGWLAAEQLESQLARASQVLIPSSYEPFGLVALEAMSLGTPVLAADIGGLRMTVGGDSGGRLLASRTPEVWLEHALELGRNPQLHARLSERGPVHVRRCFALATSTMRLIDEVYAAPPRTSMTSTIQHEHPATR